MPTGRPVIPAQQPLPPGWFPGSDGHATNPSGIPFYNNPLAGTGQLPPVPSGLAGQQLFYSSTAVQTTVNVDMGTALQVASTQGFPQQYPYTLLLEWGTSNQEVITITQAPTSGTGLPYTFTNVLRGQDGTTQVTHASGAQVNHGVSARDFAQTTPVFNVCGYGADPTGSNDSSMAVQNAINAAGNAIAGAIVQFPAGIFRMNSGVSYSGLNAVYIQGSGRWATQLNFYGTGPCVQMINPMLAPSIYFQGQIGYGGGVTDLAIDGTYAANGSSGLQIGDMQEAVVDITVQNFTGTGCIGIHVVNAVSWFEKTRFKAMVLNNTQNVVFEITTGYNSFGYSDFDITIYASANQDGVVLLNGADLYNGRLRLRGNFSYSTSTQTSAALRITGLTPPNSPIPGNSSILNFMELYIQVEIGFSGTFGPQTIFIDSGCSIEACSGFINFQGTWTPSNINFATNPNPYQFQGFAGVLGGDANLNPNGAVWVFAAPILYSQPFAPFYTPIWYIPCSSGDFFTITLSINTTVALNYSGGQQAGPQRKTFIVTQAASGGPYTLAWPSTGSPTLTSPTVIWPGGVPPVMSPAAGAVDVYRLETSDGITWFGSTTQAQGAWPIYTQVLATTFTTAAIGGAQTVTGMSVVLQPGDYVLSGWFPMQPAGTTGSTQTLAWTFSGTITAAAVSWRITGPASLTSAIGATITTTSGLSPTMTASGMFAEFFAHIIVTVPGTLQLTDTNTTAADRVSIIAGAYLTVQPTAA